MKTAAMLLLLLPLVIVFTGLMWFAGVWRKAEVMGTEPLIREECR